jgi:hypothetical protein
MIENAINIQVARKELPKGARPARREDREAEQRAGCARADGQRTAAKGFASVRGAEPRSGS